MRYMVLTKNSTDFFGKIGVHVTCFILGLASVVASAFAASNGYTKMSVVCCVVAIVVSVFGFAAGIISEHAKKACKDKKKK